LLPIRRATFSEGEARDFVEYFDMLVHADCEVIVVDGSPPSVFAEHRRCWGPLVRHQEVDRRFGYLNDKVNGIHTGVEIASCEKILLADDDIRYTSADVAKMCASLDQWEMVRPQNFLSPLPWWGRMEAARMLINRATLRIGDYPGTCGFRRATMLRVCHYDGDVLFDNEEMIRHFAAAGASIEYAIDFFIEKRPPSFRKWKEQRPRQAYEDFGLRLKTAFFLALPAFLVAAGLLGGWLGCAMFLGAASALSVALAYAGRARGGAAKYISAFVCPYAPLWILERTISTYCAVYWHFRHGGYPFGDQVLTKGIGRDFVAGGRIAAATAGQKSNE
jgi:hypothetical protein